MRFATPSRTPPAGLSCLLVAKATPEGEDWVAGRHTLLMDSGHVLLSSPAVSVSTSSSWSHLPHAPLNWTSRPLERRRPRGTESATMADSSPSIRRLGAHPEQNDPTKSFARTSWTQEPFPFVGHPPERCCPSQTELPARASSLAALLRIPSATPRQRRWWAYPHAPLPLLSPFTASPSS
jgi:hypothetical protein